MMIERHIVEYIGPDGERRTVLVATADELATALADRPEGWAVQYTEIHAPIAEPPPVKPKRVRK